VQAERVQNPASVQTSAAQAMQDAAHSDATQVDANLALQLIACGVTTQPVETGRSVGGNP
jgi:hypothetical protein